MKSIGVATGCGCKEIYRFPHTTYPYSSCIRSFYSSIPTFCSFKKMFFILVPVLFCNYIHISATTGVPRQPYEGCTYCFIHEEAHTNVRFISCDGHQLYERGVDLEVEGVRYIEMHHRPAAYVLGPPPSRGRISN